MLGLDKKDMKFLLIVIFLTLATPILLQPSLKVRYGTIQRRLP